MPAITGKFSKVLIGASCVVESGGWDWTRESKTHEYASCNTNGFMRTVGGTKRHNGSFRGYIDPDDNLENYFEVGDDVTLLLYVNASLWHIVPVTINTINVQTDVEEGTPIPYEVNFVGNGAWTENQSA